MAQSNKKGLILLCGSGSAHLADRLLQLDSIVAGDDEGRALPSPTTVDLPTLDAAFREHAWTLDTKYYSAQLRLWVPDAAAIAKGGGGYESTPSPQVLGGALAGMVDQIEGVILTFDPAVSGSFEEAAQWASLISSWRSAGGRADDDGEGGASDLELQLLVALSSSSSCSSSPSDEQCMGFVQWSLDRAFEFVDATGDTSLSALRAGMAERDREGLPRVYEAAEATRWSTLVMKSRGKGSSSAGAGAGSSGETRASFFGEHPQPLAQLEQQGGYGKEGSGSPVEDSGSSAQPKALAPEELDEEGEGAPSSPDSFSIFSAGDCVEVIGLKSSPQYNGKPARVVRFNGAQQRYVVRLLAPPSGVIVPGEGAGSKTLAVQPSNLRLTMEPSWSGLGQAGSTTPDDVTGTPDDHTEAGLESEMTDLQQMMEEMKLAREAAQSGDVADEERRTKAAELAVRLLYQLGDDGDDDGGDE